MERIEAPGGLITTKRYLGGKVIVTTTSANPTPVEVLVLTDHLGSTYALVNRDTGYTLNQGMSFDAWGLRRDTDWSDFTTTELVTFDTGNTRRGYTGHEHMDEVGLIHMNGRVYDPRLGRMLSADPIVQAAANTQSYNRYSYVFNNPLSYTDPSGFSAWTKFRDKILKPVVAIVIGAATFGSTLYALASTYGTVSAGVAYVSATQFVAFSAIAGGAAGFVSGAILTGNLKGAVQGAFGGAVFGGIGGYFGAYGGVGSTAHIASHAIAGGIMTELQGGKFGHGFFSAGLTKAVNVNGLITKSGTTGKILRTMAAAVVGGTASAIAGGKFANGALSAGFAQLYNAEQQTGQKRVRIAEAALEHNGDTSYALDSEKGKFPAGTWKCNLFVSDVLKEAGITPPLTGEGPWPLTANGWANRNYDILGWKIVNDPQPGDIAAIPRRGESGHVGVYISDRGAFQSDVMAANQGGVGWSPSHLRNDYFHFLAGSSGDTVYRRYVGE